MQNNAVDKGRLQIAVTTRTGFVRYPGARAHRVSYTGEPGAVVEEMQTDISGQTEVLTVNAPPLEYSMEPSESQPYSQYTVQVEADGFRPIDISGVAVLPEGNGAAGGAVGARSRQAAIRSTRSSYPANTLYGDYPAKIAEAEESKAGD